jgi:hypothetical protein
VEKVCYFETYCLIQLFQKRKMNINCDRNETDLECFRVTFDDSC